MVQANVVAEGIALQKPIVVADAPGTATAEAVGASEAAPLAKRKFRSDTSWMKPRN